MCLRTTYYIWETHSLESSTTLVLTVFLLYLTYRSLGPEGESHDIDIPFRDEHSEALVLFMLTICRVLC